MRAVVLTSALLLGACDGALDPDDPEITAARGALNSFRRDDADVHGLMKKERACRANPLAGAEKLFAPGAADQAPAPTVWPEGGTLVCAKVDGRRAEPMECGSIYTDLAKGKLVEPPKGTCMPPDVSDAYRAADDFHLKKSEKQQWLARVNAGVAALEAWAQEPAPSAIARARWVEMCQGKSELSYERVGAPPGAGPVDAVQSFRCWTRLAWMKPDGAVEALASGFAEASPDNVELQTSADAIQSMNDRTKKKALEDARAALLKGLPRS